MDLEVLRNYCLKKKGVTQYFPFDDETLVFRVGTKMFALTNINKTPITANLKCEPSMADALRRDYDGIKPGYHMNKLHWNTVDLSGSIAEEMIYWMIDTSYELVFKGLKKSEQEKIILL